MKIEYTNFKQPRVRALKYMKNISMEYAHRRSLFYRSSYLKQVYNIKINLLNSFFYKKKFFKVFYSNIKRFYPKRLDIGESIASGANKLLKQVMRKATLMEFAYNFETNYLSPNKKDYLKFLKIIPLIKNIKLISLSKFNFGTMSEFPSFLSKLRRHPKFHSLSINDNFWSPHKSEVYKNLSEASQLRQLKSIAFELGINNSTNIDKNFFVDPTQYLESLTQLISLKLWIIGLQQNIENLNAYLTNLTHLKSLDLSVFYVEEDFEINFPASIDYLVLRRLNSGRKHENDMQKLSRKSGLVKILNHTHPILGLKSLELKSWTIEDESLHHLKNLRNLHHLELSWLKNNFVRVFANMIKEFEYLKSIKVSSAFCTLENCYYFMEKLSETKTNSLISLDLTISSGLDISNKVLTRFSESLIKFGKLEVLNFDFCDPMTMDLIGFEKFILDLMKIKSLKKFRFGASEAVNFKKYEALSPQIRSQNNSKIFFDISLNSSIYESKDLFPKSFLGKMKLKSNMVTGAIILFISSLLFKFK